jgi:hypothetical protein
VDECLLIEDSLAEDPHNQGPPAEGVLTDEVHVWEVRYIRKSILPFNNLAYSRIDLLKRNIFTMIRHVPISNARPSIPS